MTAEADTDLSRRQLAWLPYWLTKGNGNWTVPEAAALLAGFLPPEPEDDARPFGPWLPGREPWAHGREAWELLARRDVARMRKWLETVSDLGTKEPSEVIATAVKAGIVPPWLDAAKGDPTCAALLPASIFDGESGGGADERSDYRKAQQRRRQKQHEGSPMTKLILGDGRDTFDRIRKAEFDGYLHTGPKRRGKVNVSAVVSEVWEAIHKHPHAPDKPALVRYVKEWLAETNPKNERSADSKSAPADV